MSFGIFTTGAFTVGGIASMGAFAIAGEYAMGGHAIAPNANDALAREFFAKHDAAAIAQMRFVAVTILSLLPVGLIAWLTRKQAKGMAVLLCAAMIPIMGQAQNDPKDWPIYNRDLLGTRYNNGENAINPGNAGKLVERWRFPAKGADLEIGVIRATPAVVDGY